ncbi:heat shock protein HslJ [Nocardia tenerifensis]|uniref:Heat shock protein HslJ n=1 Tax=Nocardia tenerifensis TaxID=228006 RepID=A0A318JQP2_9NOCA|nr:META domain-containing protein [Nocardia tenerifensis]PXX57928.1 heat shock protein HslJ [Nocardia tenerifensis]
MAATCVRFGPIVLLALLAVAACSSGDSESTPSTPNLAGRTFLSTQVDGAPIPGGGPLTLSFKDDRLSADAGCNTYSGSVALDDNKLHVSGLAGTLMGCPGERQGADEWLSALLNSDPTWQLDGAKLTLRGGNSTVTMMDKKVVRPDKPIKGTTWLVTALLTPDAQVRSQTIDEVKPTLTIADDGSVTGTAGCNRITGRATGDTNLTFQLATTKMLCPAEVMEVEQAVLKALDGKTTATVDADTLTLRNTNGSGLTLRAQ